MAEEPELAKNEKGEFISTVRTCSTRIMSMSEDQLERLLAVVDHQRGSFATPGISYDATTMISNSEVVETFLAIASIYKNVENISNANASRSFSNMKLPCGGKV